MNIVFPTSDHYKYDAWGWRCYLLEGFKKIDNVIFSKELSNECRCDRATGFLTAFEIDGQRVWYDWSDSIDKRGISAVKPNDFYFKIMLLKEEVNERMFPIGQSATYEPFLAASNTTQGYLGTGHDVYGNFRTTNFDMRVQAVQKVRAMNIRSLVGVRNYKNRPNAPHELLIEVTPYLPHLKLLQTSKISLALPGVGGDWTWRHTEIWGMGGCMLTVTPVCALPGNPEGAFIEVKRDLSDLEEKIEYYLAHEDKRREAARRGQEYFTECMSPEGQARWVLKCIGK